ncbi:MAG: hypothetical protein ACQEXQ_30010 [Bacillota bacterium]
MVQIRKSGSNWRMACFCIYVYIFDSEQARKDGLATFNQLLEKADFAAYPFAYEQKNTLVIYFNLKKENPKFGEKIQTAIQKL